MKTFLLFVLLIAVTARSEPVLNPANGHYYELIVGSFSWQDARASASARTFNGLRAHLATVTSVAENNFIASTFSTAGSGQFIWLGGREPLDNGVWIWDAGSEAGRQFSLFGAPTSPDTFAPWGGIEPNDHQADEDYLMMNLGENFAGILRGQWADAIRVPNPFDPVLGYVVEYEPAWGPRLEIRQVEAGVEISFFGEVGGRYQLQSATQLPAAPSSWANVGDPVTATGAAVVIQRPMTAAVNRFFRVELLP